VDKDVKIKCQDCGNEFVFSTAEQKFYEEKGFIPPKRCRLCRQNRKNKYERRKF
jgi:ribosomal protein S27E